MNDMKAGIPREGGESRGVRPAYLWWQRGTIYQIYPRSFMDSNGDGVGDLPGIIARLDHLRWLGVDAVWLSPIYPSPMKDFGYDVADYTGVNPLFGTLADFDRLVAEAHARELKVILDFVPNHSSDQHRWFVESRASRDNAKRDWYIWRDPAPGGGPPNNWLSCFGGSAWQLDPATGQYYYHAFLPEQPDLNWRNPEVVDAMMDVLRFWLDRGVDGFRVDVLWHLIKDDQFRDNPPNPDWAPGRDPYQQLIPVYTTDRPEVHGIVKRMRGLLDEYTDRMFIGEIYLPIEKLVQYYGGTDLKGAHLPFNFQLINAKWDARHIAGLIREYEGALPDGAWPNWVLGNHDQHRIASRCGPAQARVAAMLLLTLRGTPTLYYGDEIGMHDVPIPPERVQDPFEKNVPGKGLGRDPERTPMQWSRGEKAGFTTGEPWLPIADDFARVNVEALRDDPTSILTLYWRLIALRRGEPAIEVGRLEPIEADGDVLAYVRRGRKGECSFLVALNLGARGHVLHREAGAPPGTIVLSTLLDRAGERVKGNIALRGDEGLVVRLADEA
ncbi:MAG TPA: alpha-amylase family glycosyl hydrolase [Usitatibacter sp.]|nr:alpha-amylase family glycosyl hydrolase [Usitatibacter sp.]